MWLWRLAACGFGRRVEEDDEAVDFQTVEVCGKDLGEGLKEDCREDEQTRAAKMLAIKKKTVGCVL